MPSPNSAFEKLTELGRKLEALDHAQSMLGVDEAVMMPHGGGEKRAESMAVLAGMYHEMATAPGIADWLAAAAEEPLDDMQQAAIREQARVYTNMTCLSSDFVRRQVVARMRSEQLWRGAARQGRLGRASSPPSRASSPLHARKPSCAPRRLASILTTR